MAEIQGICRNNFIELNSYGIHAEQIEADG